jgi:Domain of unknown function (DUF4124)
MSTRILVLGCLLAALAGSSYAATREVWVWVDSQGVTHYSDRPVPGAKRMSVTSMSPSADAPVISPTPSTTVNTARSSSQAAAVQYSVLEFFEPQDGESFFGADTVVNVRLRTEPDLAAGDVARLYLDGSPVEGQEQGLEYSLSGLERGAHSIIARVVDAQGNEKIRSEPRVFHIRQASVVPAQNVGPNLRPRPSPRPGT